MSQFKDKVVVVTGGNSGIGAAVVKNFSNAGAKLVVFGRNQQTLDEVSSSLSSENITVQGDVKNLADIDRLMSEAKNHFGKIDVLIANAGVANKAHVSEIDEDYFDEIVDTNYKGLFFTVQKATEILNKGASVILIASVAGHIGVINHSVYSSTKAAVSQLAKNFAADLAQYNIRVNAISPGYTDTPIFDSRRNAEDDFLEKRLPHVPLKRFASPDEIANAAMFLSSQEGAYITGVDLIIDGGMAGVYPIST